jgi:hypothetical protein
MPAARFRFASPFLRSLAREGACGRIPSAAPMPFWCDPSVNFRARGGRCRRDMNGDYRPLPQPRAIVSGVRAGAVVGDDSMNSKSILATLVLTGLAIAPIASASATRVKQGGAAANKAFASCKRGGGKTQTDGNVTSCFNGSGHGVVCGGVDYTKHPDHKGTCDTFRRSPNNPKGQTAVELSRMKQMSMTPMAPGH